VLLDELVKTSGEVGTTAARSAKAERLATLLRRLAPGEIEVAVALLAGEVRQGRLGIGPATLGQARSSTAAERPQLTLDEVDLTFTRLRTLAGPGSTAERLRQLGGLLRRATPAEQDFLHRLFVGELRQGALAGLMTEALARAAKISPAELRRALLLAGDLTAVAQAVLTRGREGLADFHLQLQRCAAEPALPGGHGPALRAGQGLPRGQDARRG
jgi:DNA ligase-1